MLWELNNPDKSYFDDIPIHAFVDKEALLDFIVMECGDLRVVDNNSGFFYERVRMFFKIHKWNIDKLCESQQYEYEPLDNYHSIEDRKVDRDVAFDSVTDRDQTDDTVTDRGVTEDEHTHKDWTDKGTTDEQDVHYISAYNDLESPEQIGTDKLGRPIYKFNDTEHDRDTIDVSYQKSGDDDIQRDNSIEEGITVKDVLSEDIRKNDVTDEDIIEHKTKSGNNGQSYQSLIEEERKQAQFNIYKWILNHWFHEMMITVW